MEGNRVLAIAAASCRVGYVFLVDKKLYGWSISRKAAAGPEEAARFAKTWIDRLQPSVVVTEQFTPNCRKGESARAVMEAITTVAANEELFDVTVPRVNRYPNKFLEAEALAGRYPELLPRVPKPRKLWDSEPRNTSIFEALALALDVIDREPEQPPS